MELLAKIVNSIQLLAILDVFQGSEYASRNEKSILVSEINIASIFLPFIFTRGSNLLSMYVYIFIFRVFPNLGDGNKSPHQPRICSSLHEKKYKPNLVLCYNPIKTSFLAVTIAADFYFNFIFFLHTGQKRSILNSFITLHF